MKRQMLTIAVLLLALLAPSAAQAFRESGDASAEQVGIKVWLDEANGSVLRPGEYAQIYFQAETDCYVAVYNIDTEGFVNLLYPRYGDTGWTGGQQIYSVPSEQDDYDLIVEGPRGIEYVVAIASQYPLNLSYLAEAGQSWTGSSMVTTARVSGDPSEAIYEINEALAWGDDTHTPLGVASDIGWFYIEQQVPYPRYMVYSWYPDQYWNPWWDPYDNVDLFIDFHWGHDWCRPYWWQQHYRPHHHHDYWYTMHGNSGHSRWKCSVHNDGWRPPHREKRGRGYVSDNNRGTRYKTGRIEKEKVRDKGSRVVDTRRGSKTRVTNDHRLPRKTDRPAVTTRPNRNAKDPRRNGKVVKETKKPETKKQQVKPPAAPPRVSKPKVTKPQSAPPKTKANKDSGKKSEDKPRPKRKGK